LHPNNNITHAIIVVDLFCLGVRDAFWIFNQKPHDFKALIDKQIKANENGLNIIKTNYALVHNIIYGAVAFAEEFGFHPHKDFELTNLKDTYPDLFPKEKLHFIKAIKIPYLFEWCKEWMKKNS